MASVAIELINALRPDMPPVHASALADTGAMMLCIPSSVASGQPGCPAAPRLTPDNIPWVVWNASLPLSPP